MQPTGNPNIQNNNYQTVIIPQQSFDSVKQKLGDEYVWKYNEKTNLVYLSEKPKSNKDFSTEYGEDMSPLAHDWYSGEMANRWDD